MIDLIPAAQYLRVSTDYQAVSLKNQRVKIAEYAAAHGFVISSTYQDPGTSGITLRHRKGLTALLGAVLSGDSGLQAILVYDVSRWGRFQDSDEAAHYEYLCRSAGVPVHYCAEQFINDDSLSTMVLKTLKRTMASEFSKELGRNVFDSQKSLAEQGFHIGNCPAYGLRRQLLSGQGIRKQVLNRGEWQSIQTDRTVLVLGPTQEVETVRTIFKSALSGASPKLIAEKLNQDGIPFVSGKKWRGYMVSEILRNPKYAGCSAWNRTSQRLHGGRIRNPRSSWVIHEGAFDAIVNKATFDAVQRKLGARRSDLTEAEALSALQDLHRGKGRLSQSIITQAHKSGEIPWGRDSYERIAPLPELYRRVGYDASPRELYSGSKRAKTQRITSAVLKQVVQIFGDRVHLYRLDGCFRKIVGVVGKRSISVYTCSFSPGHAEDTWLLSACLSEAANISLLCLCPKCEEDSIRYYLVRSIAKDGAYLFTLSSTLIRDALPLETLAELLEKAEQCS